MISNPCKNKISMSELVIKTALENGDLKMDFKMNFVESLFISFFCMDLKSLQ